METRIRQGFSTNRETRFVRRPHSSWELWCGTASRRKASATWIGATTAGSRVTRGYVPNFEPTSHALPHGLEQWPAHTMKRFHPVPRRGLGTSGFLMRYSIIVELRAPSPQAADKPLLSASAVALMMASEVIVALVVASTPLTPCLLMIFAGVSASAP